MNLGKNIGNAFLVVFETLQSVEKLINKCKAELDEEKYYMPIENFLRWNSDKHWSGWVYWSFILLFQRRKDGNVGKNGYINGAFYAVEINLDAEEYDEPQLIVAKFEFENVSGWLDKSSSPITKSDHGYFYSAIHEQGIYEKKDVKNEVVKIATVEGCEEQGFWGFRKLYYRAYRLVDVSQSNYKEMIFGTIEELSKTDF